MSGNYTEGAGQISATLLCDFVSSRLLFFGFTHVRKANFCRKQLCQSHFFCKEIFSKIGSFLFFKFWLLLLLFFSTGLILKQMIIYLYEFCIWKFKHVNVRMLFHDFELYYFDFHSNSRWITFSAVTSMLDKLIFGL